MRFDWFLPYLRKTKPDRLDRSVGAVQTMCFAVGGVWFPMVSQGQFDDSQGIDASCERDDNSTVSIQWRHIFEMRPCVS